MFHLLLGIIYLAFVSLGLPDSLLGAAWPSIYPEFSVPVSYMGGISMIIAAGTIVSSLQSGRLTARFGTGRVTAFSVLLTAAALFGFSISRSYLELCLWAVPYGLGAGCVDASLNNYVALHYASRHMSWLHCMWGIGASLGPYAMTFALAGGQGWNMGYRYISFLQIGLTVILVLSLGLWKGRSGAAEGGEERALPLRQAIAAPGTREMMLLFFCYCALETTAGQWASSYLVLARGLDEQTAAGCASLFYLGVTGGRALSGFLTMRLSDRSMVRLGLAMITVGVLALLLPLGPAAAFAGFVLTGLGCAPIYPCAIHATPELFGADRSQALIGIQMASAYVGTCLMPPLFGLMANHISAALLPWYLVVFLAGMALAHQRLYHRCGGSGTAL